MSGKTLIDIQLRNDILLYLEFNRQTQEANDLYVRLKPKKRRSMKQQQQ